MMDVSDENQRLDALPMTNLAEQGRPEPPLAADEVATLLGFLGYQRATLAWKCAGLDAAGLCATVGASSITLGGLLKYLAYVEDYWFSQRLHGHDRRPPWDAVDWAADPDWDWHSAAEDSPEELFALWWDAVTRSRSLVAEALADGGLGRRPDAQPALDHRPHDRGVRAPQRPRRPAPRGGRRARRGVSKGAGEEL